MIVQKKDSTIYIKPSFDDLQRFKTIVRGSVWDPTTRYWKAPATISTYKNLVAYNPTGMEPAKLSPAIREWVRECNALSKRLLELQKGEGKPVVFPEDFQFHVYNPLAYQAQGIAFCMNIPKSCLWMDLGMGKTFTSISVARFRHQYEGLNKFLVICPRSIMRQWEDSVTSFTNNEATVCILEDTPAKKKNLLTAIQSSKKYLFAIITYESVYGVLQDLIDADFDMFILDESTRIKNPKARRTKAVTTLTKTIPYGIEMTGLAYLNNPVDLFSQFNALDSTVFGHNEYSFCDRYIDYISVPFGPGKIPRGIKREKELKDRCYFVAFSRDKDTCLGLPEKMYIQRRLPMYDTQKVWYDKVRSEIKSEVAAAVEHNNERVMINGVLAKMEKLQQITSGFIIDEQGRTIWFDSPKYDEVCDIILDSKDKFIVWVRHKETLDRILEKLRNKSIFAEGINNKVQGEQRKHIINEFRNGTTLRVLVCQIQSESQGNDFTSSNSQISAIYLENSFSLDQRHQSEGRQHRLGMTGTATYVDMILEDTVDEDIMDSIKNKLDVAMYIAKFGATKIGRGGNSVMKRGNSRSKAMPKPEDFEEPQEFLDVAGLEGFEDSGLRRRR